MNSTIRAFLLRLSGLFDQERTRHEIREEMESHLQMQIADNIRSGMTSAEARRSALVESGGLTSAQEACLDRRGLPLVENFFRDVRYALRTLRRSPSFTLTALMTLALGIGANTSIFSLVDAFLLRPLPVKDPQELVLVRRAFLNSTFEKFRDGCRSFSGMFAYDESHVTVTIDGRPEYVDGDFVSGNYFDVLGVGTIAGRAFGSDDGQPGRQTVAVISYRYWNDRFGREPSVIGKTVYLADKPFIIIGVTPPGFFGRIVAGKSADITLPMSARGGLALKDHDSVLAMARLNPGVSLQQAQAEAELIYGQLLTAGASGPTSPRLDRELRAQRIELTPGFRGSSNTSGSFGTELRILAGVVVVALLIACVNVTNLLLARGSGRHREIAVRLSLGASRGCLIRQMLTESAVLAMAGGVLGLLVARAGVGLLLGVLAYGQGSIPFDFSVDLRILGFTSAVSLLVGVLFGLAPAMAAARVDLVSSLKGNERGAESGPTPLRAISLLVVLQVALSLVLLVASGLMIRSLRSLYDVDFGFNRERVLTAWVFPALAGYDHPHEMRLYGELLEKLNTLPGIRSASLLRIRILRGGAYRNMWSQTPEIVPEQSRKVRFDVIGPRFFDTLGIGLLFGREFSSRDSETAVKVAIISESTARKFFPNQNPIGLRLGFDRPDASGDVQIVGVVRDIRHQVPEDRPPETVYIPYTQASPRNLGQMNLMVRTLASPGTVITAIQDQVKSIDRNLPLVGVQTESQEIDDALGGRRSLAMLLTIFGALALVLTSIGLFGTISHAVSRRTRELGIRMALGAEKQDVLWAVMRQALVVVLIGASIGVPAAAVATRLIASMLFTVGTSDPITIAAAIFVMFATALLATWIPARRAVRVDPMVALRCD
jgi:predicted permease